MLFGTRTLRATAATTLFFFIWMTLHPALAAAVQSAPPPTQAGSAKSLLDDLRDAARRGQAKAGRGEGHDEDDRRLMEGEANLDVRSQAEEAEFAEVEQHLDDHGLPAEIKQRHAQALGEYRAKLKELKSKLRAFHEAHDRHGADESARRDDLADFLQKNQKIRPHQPFDPKRLPFQAPSEQIRPPKERKEELDQLVNPAQPVKVAASELTPGLLAAADPTPSATPTAADLAETEDALFTPAIRAQAEALHRNPVEIFNFVRNAIEFLPTYGSIQGADQTLQTRRGNAFDTASLLVALLRASNIPARYAYGTIQVPADQVMNWVGGVKTPEAAQSLLSQGGIPNTMLVSGGKIVAFKLEQVWVEAFVDYVPSRGAVNRVGDTWVPMDASFKQYRYQNYVDIRQDSPFQAQTFIDVLTNNATVSPQEGWISNVDLQALENAHHQAETDIQSWMDRVLSEGKDWRRLKSVADSTPKILMGVLPYQVIATANRFTSIASGQRTQFRFELYASDMDRMFGSSVLSYSASLPKLAGKRLTLGFAPASDADWQLIRSYLPSLPQGQAYTPADLPSTLPGYLIHLTAVLLLDDQPIARGGSFTMGQDVFSTTAISKLSGGFHEAFNSHLAGEFLAIGIDLQGYGESQLTKAKPRNTINVLHQAATAYFHRRDVDMENFALLGQAIVYPAPSFGFFGTSLAPQYRFGLVSKVKLNGVQFDVDVSTQTLVTPDNDKVARLRTLEQLGMALSAREHEIPETHLTNSQFPGQGVSAMKALSVALAQGQRVYKVDSANLNAVLPRLALPLDTETDVRNAVNAGQEAVIHERPLMIGGWSGMGYILKDPATGSGAYRISGGLNGGFSEAEMAEALAFEGLSMFASAGAALVNFLIPAAHADTGLCGQAEKERVPASRLAVNLIYAVGIGIVLGVIVTTLPPAGIAAAGALVAVFTSSAAAAQAREGLCYVYYIGGTDHKGQDITQLQGHILSAIQAKQGFNNGLGISNLTYASSTMKMAAGANRSWYNLKEYANSGCGDVDSRPANTACDEYPFFSTHQGGPQFYPDGVSLRLVDAKQNRDQGITVGAFYRSCFGNAVGTAYSVAPGDYTHGSVVDKDGVQTQCWPRPGVPATIPNDAFEEEGD